MASVYAKGKTWYASLKGPDGEWFNESTEIEVGETEETREQSKELARRFARKAQQLLDAKRKPTEDGKVPTLEAYAVQWIKDRRELGVASVNDDEARLTIHVYPTLGPMRLDEVRPRDIRGLIKRLRKKGELAPRTIRNVYGVVSTLFRTAVADEVINATPCVILKGDLPKMVDADPEWRDTAVFTREEVERLYTADELLPDRRVLYALKGLAALRQGEAAKLRWRHIDLDVRPLGKISLGRTKTQTPRQVPIHPALAAVLRSWLETGWKSVYGRAPIAEDLVVPTRRFNERNPSDAQHRFLADLELLELRSRRGHDMRRTFISLARSAGANVDILKAMTHGPSGKVIDAYTTWPWDVLCAELAKLQFVVPAEPSYLLPTAPEAPVKATATTRREKQNPALSSGALAVPTGVERVAGSVRVREPALAPRRARVRSAVWNADVRASVGKFSTGLRRALRSEDLDRAIILTAEFVGFLKGLR